MMEMFDQLRQAFPNCGFNLYAIEPRRPVTFEVITESGEVFTFTGPTAAAAMAKAFPEQNHPTTDTQPAPPSQEVSNVFD